MSYRSYSRLRLQWKESARILAERGGVPDPRLEFGTWQSCLLTSRAWRRWVLPLPFSTWGHGGSGGSSLLPTLISDEGWGAAEDAVKREQSTLGPETALGAGAVRSKGVRKQRQISYDVISLWHLVFSMIQMNLITKPKQTHRLGNKLMVIKGKVVESMTNVYICTCASICVYIRVYLCTCIPILLLIYFRWGILIKGSHKDFKITVVFSDVCVCVSVYKRDKWRTQTHQVHLRWMNSLKHV